MKFTKDGVTYGVKDPAHIDCFKAKGWTVVEEAPEKAPAQKPETPKAPAKGKK